MKERSLVAFTILGQTAVGAFITLTLTRSWLSSQSVIKSDDPVANQILPAIILILGISLLTSFFHLGDPLNSWRAISNLRSSWLSREILFALTFFAFLGLYSGLEWMNVGSPGFRGLISLLTVAIALFLVYSMAKVYSLRTIPTWNAARTFASFCFTSLLLGGLFFNAAYMLIWANHWHLKQAGALILKTLTVPIYWLAISSLLLIGVEFLRILVFTDRSLYGHGDLLTIGHPKQLKLLSLVMLFISAVIILSLFIFSLNTLDTRLVFLSVFCLVLIAETANRVVFYKSHRPSM